MSRILGSFCKRVLRSAVSFPVIVTRQYLPQVLKRDICNLITKPLDHCSTFLLVYFLSYLHDGNFGERRLLSWRNFHSKSLLSPISALPRADIPLLAYTWKIKTVSAESISGKLGCLSFKMFYIRKPQTINENSTTYRTPCRRNTFFALFIVDVKKLLDLIYGPTKTDLCIISLYFWLPSIEMV